MSRALYSHLTPREIELRDAAIAFSSGERPSHPDPAEPNNVEEGYLAAIDLFRCGRQCAAWDCLDLADKLASKGLRGDPPPAETIDRVLDASRDPWGAL